MQDTQGDPNCCKRVEEHLKKSITTTNFKIMKKVIQSRLEVTNHGSPKFGPESLAQPPLPLDPPPPDNMILNLQVKEEIEDPEYQNAYTSPRAETFNETQSPIRAPTVEPQEKKRPICRDFIRGTCKRQGSCKYAHKRDLSQLEGVYTFCRQYQNNVCTFTNCKFVHASVFEEQEFYRSGYLPPHAFAHHRVNVLPPPPPPPPEEPPVDVLLNINFSKPPPPMQNECNAKCNEIDKPMMPCIPSTSNDARIFVDNMGNSIPSSNPSTLKRDWSQMEQFPPAPRDLGFNEQLAKKCKHCHIMEYRLQYNKDKVEQMIHSKEELNKKMATLEIKSDKLYSIILTLLKPTFTAKTPSHQNAVNGDKDKSWWDQLNSILNANSRLSARGEDK